MSTIELAMPNDLRALAEQSNAWPFEQAKAIVARLKKKPKDEVLFETGYGPSGLPHIGTFGEVARTTMVRHAFRVLTEDKIRTRLIAFSDDMDGLRKVPDNVPNKEMLSGYLGMPLTKVPDPFGTHASFGAHNNARLRAFLDTFGFDYEFASSTALGTGTHRPGDGDHAAVLARGTRGELLAVSPDLSAHRRGAAGADHGA
jgi:lysyl-tRNA synthetase, class I